MSTQRPGCRHFSRDALEAVAGMDPFDWLYRGEFRRRSDERDLLAALLLAEGKADEMHGLTAGGVFAACRLGLDPTEPVGGRATRELIALGWLADAGGCATTEALRGVLLGAAPPVSHEARARDETMLGEDGC